MKKILIILLCFPLRFISCLNDPQQNKSQNTITNTVFSFNVTSKNSEITSRSGKDVSLNEMTTINVKSAEPTI